MATENEYISAISRIFASADASHESVIVGIGDDAAVLCAPADPIVLTTDMAIEGNHFKREWSSLFEIGAKITAANLADVYAMGGTPTHLLVAAAIPATFSVADVEELALGIADEAKKVGAIVVGGDLAMSPLLTISITALGSVQSKLTIKDARVGDFVAVSALPGASARGFKDLQNGVDSDDAKLHRRPILDYAKYASTNHAHTHALCDISDGLVSEAERIARASEVRIELFGKVLTTPEILHGGEDHVLLGTFTEVPPGWILVGSVSPGAGVWLDGKPISHQGYVHFK